MQRPRVSRTCECLHSKDSRKSEGHSSPVAGWWAVEDVAPKWLRSQWRDWLDSSRRTPEPQFPYLPTRLRPPRRALLGYGDSLLGFPGPQWPLWGCVCDLTWVAGIPGPKSHPPTV